MATDHLTEIVVYQRRAKLSVVSTIDLLDQFAGDVESKLLAPTIEPDLLDDASQLVVRKGATFALGVRQCDELAALIVLESI
ncbi:hypothetical protein [Burkholderia cenocepacia]|nr:hypothetical protein [Burkholderia cenocepacia]MDT6995415.1 hypothetical protein [Burkholderia cenocepacia]